jgi:hypothetical protein
LKTCIVCREEALLASALRRRRAAIIFDGK